MVVSPTVVLLVVGIVVRSIVVEAVEDGTVVVLI